MKLLDEATAALGAKKTLPGDVAFKLYDTFGFPYDLTEDALRSRGIGVDKAGFDAAMAKQKADARAAWAGSGEAATETVWFELREKLGATEFLGYDTEIAEGIVTALLKGGQPVAQLNAGDEGQVLVNQTPFYGEFGGQVGDEGVMFTKAGAEFAVSDTQKKLGDVHVHIGKLDRGTLKVGDVVDLRVDGAASDGDAGQSFGDAFAARGAAAGVGDACHAEGVASRARQVALRFQSSRSR